MSAEDNYIRDGYGLVVDMPLVRDPVTGREHRVPMRDVPYYLNDLGYFIVVPSPASAPENPTA
jgi:hypothetical protein